MEPATEPQSQSGGLFVPLSPQKRVPTAEAAQGPAESINLVSHFSKEELEKIAATCIKDYDADVQSRSGRMRKLKEFQELYAGLTKAKSFPFQNAANVNLPVLTYQSLQVHARLFDMVWPANGKVIHSSPTGMNDVARASSTEKFGNSYIRHKMPEMGRGMDDTLAQMVIYGSAFRRTYWDAAEGRVRSDWIPLEDFVVAHTQRSQDPSMRDVPRYTMVMHLTIYDLEDYAAKKWFANVDGIRAEDNDGSSESEFEATRRKVDGVQPASDASDEDKPRQVLEQHRVWRLPRRSGKHPAFDGKPHPVIITIDEQSERILRIVLREEDDPDDLRRFTREQAAFDQAVMLQQAYEQEMAGISRALTIASAMGKPIPADLPMPMAPPAPVAPEPARKREICFFTHYCAFPSEGFYGLGFGDFLGPVVKAANTILNQHIDGVTLKNAKPVFMSRQLRTQRGAVNIQPGEVVEVDGPTQALRDGIMWMDPPQNDPTTMPLVQFLVTFADKVGGNSDIMSGQPPGSNQTARGMMILAEEMRMQISVLARRTKEAFQHELQKIWRCWGVFLPDQEVVDVIGEDGSPGQVEIGRAMFIPDANVIPAADPRSKWQKTEEAMNLYTIAMQNPILQQNPVVLRAVTEDLLRAHDAARIISLLGPPPGPPEPPKPAAPWEEEAGWLRGQDHPVHPDDDDEQHKQMHLHFAQSPGAQMLDKQGREMLERHVRHHEASALEKRGRAAMQQAQQAPSLGAMLGGAPGGQMPAGM